MQREGGLVGGRKLLLITVGGCRCACRWRELVMWAYAQDVVLHHKLFTVWLCEKRSDAGA